MKATIFAALLKEVPMGCKDILLPDALLENLSVKCLTIGETSRKPYNDNLWLFRALALHFHGNGRIERKTSNLFNLFLKRTDESDPANFRGVCMEDIAAVDVNV